MGWVDSSQNNDKDNLVNWRAGEEELSFADDWLWVTMNRGRKQGWHKHAKFVCFLFPSWPFLLLRKIDRPSVTTKRWRGIDKTQLMPVYVGQPALPLIACLRATYDLHMTLQRTTQPPLSALIWTAAYLLTMEWRLKINQSRTKWDWIILCD